MAKFKKMLAEIISIDLLSLENCLAYFCFRCPIELGRVLNNIKTFSIALPFALTYWYMNFG